jgi:hypothetical protein
MDESSPQRRILIARYFAHFRLFLVRLTRGNDGSRQLSPGSQRLRNLPFVRVHAKVM